VTNGENMTKETVSQIKERIAERFDILDILTQECLNGNSRALIVSGPPGLGKSFTVERRLKESSNELFYSIVKGYVRPTGLFTMLYKHRNKGDVLVFDDADTIFFDDTSLNLLKTVCDTTEKRTVSWLSRTNFKDEDNENIPKSFDFEGSVIFITNLDFDALIAKSHKLAPHLKALISRAHYIELGMKSKEDYVVRIQQVIENGLLSALNESEREDVTHFLKSNINKLREISLRMAIKLGAIRRGKSDWEKIARVTCCKN